jgi:hypothetical protein
VELKYLPVSIEFGEIRKSRNEIRFK